MSDLEIDGLPLWYKQKYGVARNVSPQDGLWIGGKRVMDAEEFGKMIVDDIIKALLALEKK